MPPAAAKTKPSESILTPVGPWYLRQSWLEAKIDLRTPFEIDGAVVIRDPRRERTREERDGAGGPDAEALTLRAYVHSGPGVPAGNAPLAAWKAWGAKQPTQVVERILRGISRFRSELFAEDADYAAAQPVKGAGDGADGFADGVAGEEDGNPND